MKANERDKGMKICKMISTIIGFLINMFDFIIQESLMDEIKLFEIFVQKKKLLEIGGVD